MLGVIHVTNATADPYRPAGAAPGWEVDLPTNFGNPLPGDRVRIRHGRAAAAPGRVYAVNYATNKMYVELLTDGDEL